MGFTPYGSPLTKAAATPLAGFALQDATPNILQYTFPNDGNLHIVNLTCLTVVSSAETGGAFGINITEADGTVRTPGISAGTLGTGATRSFTSYMVQPGSTVTLEQTSALTAGAATVWAELWVS